MQQWVNECRAPLLLLMLVVNPGRAKRNLESCWSCVRNVESNAETALRS